MKTRTEKILVLLRILAFMGAIKYSIDFGAQLTHFVASFINAAWANVPAHLLVNVNRSHLTLS